MKDTEMLEVWRNHYSKELYHCERTKTSLSTIIMEVVVFVVIILQLLSFLQFNKTANHLKDFTDSYKIAYIQMSANQPLKIIATGEELASDADSYKGFGLVNFFENNVDSSVSMLTDTNEITKVEDLVQVAQNTKMVGFIMYIVLAIIVVSMIASIALWDEHPKYALKFFSSVNSTTKRPSFVRGIEFTDECETKHILIDMGKSGFLDLYYLSDSSKVLDGFTPTSIKRIITREEAETLILSVLNRNNPDKPLDE